MPQMAIPIAVGIVAGAVMASAMQPSMAQTDYSTKINTTGTDVEIPVIYGNTRTGCHRVFNEVVGSKDGNDILTCVYSLSEGPIHSIQQIYIDEKPLFKRERAYTTGTIGYGDISDNFKKHVQVQISNGEKEGYAFPMAIQNSDGLWTNKHKGQGIAAICLKIKLDGWKGVIKGDNFNVRIQAEGRPVRDIRRVGNPRAYRFNDGTEPARNPALCLFDYLTDVDYGGSFSDDDLDIQSFIEAANWCDAHGLTCDGVVNQRQSYQKNIEELMSAFGGLLIDGDGEIYNVVDKPAPVVKHFDGDNIIGKYEVDYLSNKKYFNQLQTTWTNPSNQYQKDVSVYPPSINDPRIQTDGRPISQRLELPFTKNQNAVDFLSSKTLLQSENVTEIKFTADVDGFLVQVHDVITVTLPEDKFNKKAFRITEIKRDVFGSNPGSASITATEYNQEVYEVTYTGKTSSKPPKPKKVPSANNLKYSTVDSRFGLTGLLTWKGSMYSVRDTLVLYKSPYQDDSEFILYNSVSQSQECLISGLPAGYYDFCVINQNIWGMHSEPAYLRKVDLRDDTLMPQVTNLKGVCDDSPDFTFTWDDMLDVDIDKSDIDPDLPAALRANSKVRDFFLCYEVRIYNRDNFDMLKTENIISNKYTYTYNDNVKNGLTRNVGIMVKVVSKFGAKSETASVNTINSQSKVPDGIDVKGGLSGLFVNFLQPEQLDHKGVEIHMSRDIDFTPNASTLIKDLTATNFLAIPTAEEGDLYIKLGAYDCFGRDKIVYSKSYHASITSSEAMLEDISKDQLSQELQNFLNGRVSQSDIDKAIADIPEVDLTKVNADISKAKQDAIDKSTSDINKAKQELRTEIENVEVDLSPIDSRITAVEKASTDADKALTTKIDSAITKTDNNRASITALSKTVTDNNKAVSTQIESVEAKADKATSDISKETTARVEADEAISTQIDTVKAETAKNKASINEVSTTLTDTEQSLSSKIDTVKAQASTDAKNKADAALSNANKHSDAAITTERTARSTADNALSTRIDTVTAASNKNKADIKTVNKAVTEKNAAMASRVTSIETSVDDVTDKTTTTEQALNSAKVSLAKKAVDEAAKALTAAKADASSKANSAKAQAKVDAAKDAKAKADAALVNAKKYADQKKAEAVGHTNSKFNEAVKLINDKDTAQASKITLIESKTNTAKSRADQALSVATASNGKANSMYTLRLDSNGKVAGFGLSNNGETSVFSINADKFLIYDGTQDQAVFAVTDGKLVVNKAFIGDLDANSLAAGSITSAHLETDIIKANSALIEDGAINNAKIGSVIQSENYAEINGLPSTGWKIDKSGQITCANLKATGEIYGGHLLGGLVEGAVFVSNSDISAPCAVNDYDKKNGGKRAFYNTSFSVSGSAGGSSSASGLWTSVRAIASYNYTSAGTVKYTGNQYAWKNYNRYRRSKIAPGMYAKGWVRQNTSGLSTYPRDISNASVRFIIANSSGGYLKDIRHTFSLPGRKTWSGRGNKPMSGSGSKPQPPGGQFPSNQTYYHNINTDVRIKFRVHWTWARNYKVTGWGSYGGKQYTTYARQVPHLYEFWLERRDKNGSWSSSSTCGRGRSGAWDMTYSGNSTGIKGYASIGASGAGKVNTYISFSDTTNKY